MFLALAVVLAALSPAGAGADPAAGKRRDLTELSLTELAAPEGTTGTRSAGARARPPAAVTVITPQDIRRSGATTLAEALRLAPGIQVSRIDASHWAIGMRGFASQLSRSVLVLIDGRSV